MVSGHKPYDHIIYTLFYLINYIILAYSDVKKIIIEFLYKSSKPILSFSNEVIFCIFCKMQSAKTKTAFFWIKIKAHFNRKTGK